MLRKSWRGGVCLAALQCLLLSPVDAAVRVGTLDGERRVSAATYQATIAADGLLTRLAIGGVEFLRPTSATNRGAYPHQGQTQALPQITAPDTNTVVAENDKARVTYAFADDALTMTILNRTTQPMNYYLAIDKVATVVSDGQAEFAKLPAARAWSSAVYYAGSAKLTVKGGERQWPQRFENDFAVSQTVLDGGETATITLTPGTATADEAAKVAAVAGGAADPGPAVALDAPAADSLAVEFPTYKAYVAKDGSLTNLLIDGQEFLAPGVSFSRGVYFYQGAVRPMPNVSRDGNTISADGPAIAAKYEFAPDGMTWTVTNKSAQAGEFFMVFAADLAAGQGPDGSFAKPFIGKDWTASTWYKGRAKLGTTGATRVWGPWEQRHQVWDARLEPGETRTLKFTVGRSTDEEAAKVAALGPAPAAAPVAPAAPTFTETALTVLSPRDLQVFQRRTRTQGSILLSGRVKPEADKLEAKITGAGLGGALPDTWQTIPLLPPTRMFRTELATPAGGWYTVSLRASKGDATVAETTIAKVGVGEVFVGAGQSNSTNYGQERTKQTTGMVSSFSGSAWQLADDPQPGAHDTQKGGSFWPAFGDAMYQKYKVPIGVATTGHGGTSVNAWQPGGELHNWMMTRIYELGPGGFRALLWHQGESDVNMNPDEYVAKLTNTIWASKQLAGWEFPWFVAQVSYHNPDNPRYGSTRGAHAKLWSTGVALEGPDTDTLTGDMRDNGGKGIHFSAKGLKAHGEMWAEKVGAWLDKVLAE